MIILVLCQLLQASYDLIWRLEMLRKQLHLLINAATGFFLQAIVLFIFYPGPSANIHC